MRLETRWVLKSGAFRFLSLPAVVRNLLITSFGSLVLFLPRVAVKEPSLHLGAAWLQVSCCGLPLPRQSQCQGHHCLLAEACVLGIAVVVFSCFVLENVKEQMIFKMPHWRNSVLLVSCTLLAKMELIPVRWSPSTCCVAQPYVLVQLGNESAWVQVLEYSSLGVNSGKMLSNSFIVFSGPLHFSPL